MERQWKKIRGKKKKRGEGGRGSHFGQTSQMWEQCPVTELNDAGFCSSFNLACVLSPTSHTLNPNTAWWSACVSRQSYIPPLTVCVCLSLSISLFFWVGGGGMFFFSISHSCFPFTFHISWTQPLSNEANCQSERKETKLLGWGWSEERVNSGISEFLFIVM